MNSVWSAMLKLKSQSSARDIYEYLYLRVYVRGLIANRKHVSLNGTKRASIRSDVSGECGELPMPPLSS